MFKVCLHCNTVNSDIARFCRECGRTAFDVKTGFAKQGERYTGDIPARVPRGRSGPASPKTKPKGKAEPERKGKAEPEDKTKTEPKTKVAGKASAKKSSTEKSSTEKSSAKKAPAEKVSAEQAPADADKTYGEYRKAKAFNAAVDAAMRDDAEAMNFVGHCYETGYGTDADAACAMRWYKLSADRGNAEGLYNAGRLYAGGIGAERDEKMAAEYYRKAAASGHGPAQYRLGLCYLHGRGVKKNPIAAADLIIKAAEKGVPEAVERVKNIKP